MSYEFKVGDRVVLARPDALSLKAGHKVGDMGTIVDKDQGAPGVLLDRTGETLDFYATELDLVAPAPDLAAEVARLRGALEWIRDYGTDKQAAEVAGKALARAKEEG